MCLDRQTGARQQPCIGEGLKASEKVARLADLARISADAGSAVHAGSWCVAAGQ